MGNLVVPAVLCFNSWSYFGVTGRYFLLLTFVLLVYDRSQVLGDYVFRLKENLLYGVLL